MKPPSRQKFINDYNNVSLFKAVQSASQAEENGCRVVEEGKYSVSVYDCHVWDKKNTALLLFIRPNAEITVSSSINSLSGFKINISEPAYHGIFIRCFIVIVSAVAFALLFCFSHDHIFPWFCKQFLHLVQPAHEEI